MLKNTYGETVNEYLSRTLESITLEENRYNSQEGICENFYVITCQDRDNSIITARFFFDVSELFVNAMNSWADSRGASRAYPIEQSLAEFIMNTNKWDDSTEYGSRRFTLLRFMQTYTPETENE